MNKVHLICHLLYEVSPFTFGHDMFIPTTSWNRYYIVHIDMGIYMQSYTEMVLYRDSCAYMNGNRHIGKPY